MNYNNFNDYRKGEEVRDGTQEEKTRKDRHDKEKYAMTSLMLCKYSPKHPHYLLTDCCIVPLHFLDLLKTLKN